MKLLSDADLMKTKGTNFHMLSSTTVFDQGITVAMKKEMLKTFNQRPENIHGDLVRFIIMDSGFKEGIDLFDIKYIHIFEPSLVASDQKQVIGRGTRTCGQKGLDFHPTKGWPLDIFVYDVSFPADFRGSFLGAETAFELYLKSKNLNIRLYNFAEDLEKTAIYGAVDHDLTQNIHQFRAGGMTMMIRKLAATTTAAPPIYNIIKTQQPTISKHCAAIFKTSSPNSLGLQ